MKIFVTGGAGFIGSNFIRHVLATRKNVSIVNYDKLTYAGNLDTLASLRDVREHVFVQGDIGDRALVERLLVEHQPTAIVNFAAESHVDRSIDGPAEFVQTNVVGTLTLLEAALAYWRALPLERQDAFRFLHVSTDEVYGSLGPIGRFSISSDNPNWQRVLTFGGFVGAQAQILGQNLGNFMTDLPEIPNPGIEF